ncbi:5-oxoprolinase subunit PxpB [Paenibacillus sp. GCM10023250]|uniref:5-oxoprolinase subunit PxpB n=1 Tax=Paenibacillus sp. GCM10023250 TaxID=3252648 RepID=UPI0036219ED4
MATSDAYARFGAVRAKLFPLGDSAVAVQFGESIDLETHERVRQLTEYLERHPFEGMIEYVPAFLSVTVYYEPFALQAAHDGFDESGADAADPYGLAVRLLAGILAKLGEAEKRPARIVDIPVCYGGDLGPDLPEVAAHHGLSEQDVIDIHASADYLVYMLGFAPGFAYLGGLPARIATPRRTTPRLSIPTGTVGIAGDQTGVYPIVTPGGWQLIGKTPLPLFLPEAMPPTLLKAGDRVRFRPISRAEFDRLEVART